MNDALLEQVVSGSGEERGLTLLGWITMLAPLGMIFGLHALAAGLSAASLAIGFQIFAAIMRASMSWIFAAYIGMSIANALLTNMIAFLGMSLWGYTTKRDITGLGSFPMMGLIGLIAATVVNIFLGSSTLDFGI